MIKLRFCSLALLFLITCLGYSQNTPGWYAFHPNQEIQVHNLPPLMAKSDDPSDVLRTSLDILFHNREICCGKDSALEDRALAADPSSLKDIAAKLQGKHLLSDGRPIMVTADILATSSGDASYQIVSALVNQHAMLMAWGSHLYVLYGAIFDQTAYSDGTSMNVIHKLLLLDTRFSNSRREVVFNRNTDDWSKVQGLLLVDAEQQ